ncbi:hypothetical protein CMUS01_08725 [Colletotrichum musicola]|uniref:Uncharacterized protein n=1 Tax=Colletotrichum musicola TaxID=2175873 RepID=A0A8H6KBK3_9PEZI|nr:hypothetical protein CMUS01_08725 [Colletotrichum musicola]
MAQRDGALIVWRDVRILHLGASGLGTRFQLVVLTAGKPGFDEGLLTPTVHRDAADPAEERISGAWRPSLASLRTSGWFRARPSTSDVVATPTEYVMLSPARDPKRWCVKPCCVSHRSACDFVEALEACRGNTPASPNY